jgi:hypothetical protein
MVNLMFTTARIHFQVVITAPSGVLHSPFRSVRRENDLERLSMQRSTRERISSKVGANYLPQPAYRLGLPCSVSAKI